MQLNTSLKIIFFYLSLLWMILLLSYSLTYENHNIKKDYETFKLKKLIINHKNEYISGFMESENYKCLYFIKELNEIETKSLILSIGLEVFSENYIEQFKNHSRMANLFTLKKYKDTCIE